MSERTYKRAFVSSVVMCLALAGILAYVIWGRTYLAPATDNTTQSNLRVTAPVLPVHLHPSLQCSCLRSACRPLA